MNDRCQGGAADLSVDNTIELMQNRRTLEDDGKGVTEPLDERDLDDGLGIKANARYFMQIFDTNKSESLQRKQ